MARHDQGQDALLHPRDDWRWHMDLRQACRIIDVQMLWGEILCRVWLPDQDAILGNSRKLTYQKSQKPSTENTENTEGHRKKQTHFSLLFLCVPLCSLWILLCFSSLPLVDLVFYLLEVALHVSASRLKPLDEAPVLSKDHLTYISTAARISDTLTHDLLLAPIESSVIPLPHQIHALSRAMSGDQMRYLLADEVGLGKTIEAGLIIRELKLRGLVRRVLVIAPKGLITQWVAEMKTHFNEAFRHLLPGDFDGYRRIAGEENPWRSHPQVICSLDSVKPLEKRRGWSRQQIAAHNRDRFDGLVSAGWDLIIVDEAHRLGGSTDQVARFRLGQGVAEAAPYLLLLSATPHQGKSDAFHRLLTLLDATNFPGPASVTQERVQSYVIRTEKRRAIDADGKPLFKPRRTQMFPVSWKARHHQQKALYESVSNYVRLGYNQAVRQKKNAVGFLLILLQRLVTSSTRAIRSTLERRLEVLKLPDAQLSFVFRGGDRGVVRHGWAGVDGNPAGIPHEGRAQRTRRGQSAVGRRPELRELRPGRQG